MRTTEKEYKVDVFVKFTYYECATNETRAKKLALEEFNEETEYRFEKPEKVNVEVI